MNAERWRRIEGAFQVAVACPRAEREAALARNCGDDSGLRAEVESLLAAHDRASSFIASPAYEVAQRPQATQSLAGYPVGERIGRFTLRGVLGRGGMGIVYEAEQDNPRRVVALKLIRAELASPALRSRFEHEARLLARLQHPGIAQIYDAGTAVVGGVAQPYFAMELVRGVPIGDYVRTAAQDALPIRTRLELLARVCDAVEHAHQRGIIHRDLKPANILVSDESSANAASHTVRAAHSPPEAAPKILDFGVARAIEADVQTVTLQTDVGQLIGTIPYMSPEQVAGDPRAVDTRSDVYALGVLCYELLTGQLPYDLTGCNISDAVRIIREEDPAPMGRVQRALRGDLETIVAKAVAKDPERRYPSARALATDIRRYLAGEAIEARRDNLLYVLRRAVVRRRAGVAVTALATALLLALVWAARQQGQAGRVRNEAILQSRISALRSARANPAELEAGGSPAAEAALVIWRRVQAGSATEAEMRELAETSAWLDFREPSLLDLSRHAVREGGYGLRFATRVFACPQNYGFLLQPKFILDGSPLPVDGAGYREVQRWSLHGLHVQDLSEGQHTLTCELVITLARVAQPADKPGGLYLPISPPFTKALGPFHFAAVTEHPPDYPIQIPGSAYRRRLASELGLAAYLVPKPAQPRQPAADQDELQIELTLPRPPLDLAVRVEIRTGGFATSVDLAIAAKSQDGLPALVYHNSPERPLFARESCRTTLSIPFSAIVASANPESLAGEMVGVRLTSTRDAAREADFDRFLDVEFECAARIRDVRPQPGRESAKPEIIRGE